MVGKKKKQNLEFLVANNPPPINVGTPMGHSPNLLGGTTSPGPGGMQPSLKGVKVPDENLTPQQRAHREEQLATITKIRQILFQEQKDMSSGAMDPNSHGQMPGGICPTSNLPPVSTPNQCGMPMDWQKFMDGKKVIEIFFFFL